MSEQDNNKRAVVPMKPRPEAFLSRIQELAQDTRNVKWGTHARERMEERGIENRVALNVLRKGYIKGAIIPGKNTGEWKAKIVRQVPGRREVGVATILVKNRSVFVKTVEWEDFR